MINDRKKRLLPVYNFPGVYFYLRCIGLLVGSTQATTGTVQLWCDKGAAASGPPMLYLLCIGPWVWSRWMGVYRLLGAFLSEGVSVGWRPLGENPCDIVC